MIQKRRLRNSWNSVTLRLKKSFIAPKKAIDIDNVNLKKKFISEFAFGWNHIHVLFNQGWKLLKKYESIWDNINIFEITKEKTPKIDSHCFCLVEIVLDLVYSIISYKCYTQISLEQCKCEQMKKRGKMTRRIKEKVVIANIYHESDECADWWVFMKKSE